MKTLATILLLSWYTPVFSSAHAADTAQNEILNRPSTFDQFKDGLSSVLVWMTVPFGMEFTLAYAESLIPKDSIYLKKFLEFHRTNLRSISNKHPSERLLSDIQEKLIFFLNDHRTEQVKKAGLELHERGLALQGKYGDEAGKARLSFGTFKLLYVALMQEGNYAISVEGDEERARVLFNTLLFLINFLTPELNIEDRFLLSKDLLTEQAQITFDTLKGTDSSKIFHIHHNHTFPSSSTQYASIAIGVVLPPAILGRTHQLVDRPLEFIADNIAVAMMRPLILEGLSSLRKELQALLVSHKSERQKRSIGKTEKTLIEYQSLISKKLSERSLRQRANTGRLLALMVPKLTHSYHLYKEGDLDSALIHIADTLVYIRKLNPESKEDNLFITLVSHSILGSLLEESDVKENVLNFVQKMDDSYSSDSRVKAYYSNILDIWVKQNPSTDESQESDLYRNTLDVLYTFGVPYAFYAGSFTLEKLLFADKVPAIHTTTFLLKEFYKTCTNLIYRSISEPGKDRTGSYFQQITNNNLHDSNLNEREGELLQHVHELEGRLAIGAQKSKAVFERFYPTFLKVIQSVSEALKLRNKDEEACLQLAYISRFLSTILTEIPSNDETLKRLVHSYGLDESSLSLEAQSYLRTLLKMSDDDKAIDILETWNLLNSIDISSTSLQSSWSDDSVYYIGTGLGLILPALGNLLLAFRIQNPEGMMAQYPLLSTALVNTVVQLFHFALTNILSKTINAMGQKWVISQTITPRVDELENGSRAHKIFISHFKKARDIYTFQAQEYRSHLLIALSVMGPYFTEARTLFYEGKNEAARLHLAHAALYLHGHFPDLSFDDIFISEFENVLVGLWMGEQELSSMMQTMEEIDPELLADKDLQFFYQNLFKVWGFPK